MRAEFNHEADKLRRLIMIVKVTALAVLLLMITQACKSSPGVFTPFVKSPASRPVIASGVAGVPTFISDPCVIKDESGYHAFFSVYYVKNKKKGKHWFSYDPANPGDYDMSDCMGGLGYAFSADRGLTWTCRETPLVTTGPEEWQAHAVETANVIKLEDRLLMFYCAQGNRDGKRFTSRYQIGVASLDLGGKSIEEQLLDESVVFAKRKTPLIPIRLDKTHHLNNTQEPSVLLKDGNIELFYIGLSLSKPSEAIGKENRISNMAMYKAVFDTDLNLVSHSADPVLEGVNIIEVHYRDGVYHTFSTKSPPLLVRLFADFHKDEKITHYLSKDGVNWTEEDLILQGGGTGSFDGWGIMAPTVVFEKDQVVLFYTAWEYENRADLPESALRRFGMGRENGDAIHGTLGRAVARLKLEED
ncbi:MAG: hypothetical protein K9N49_09800 [Candidatus Marinimicrobia bacterium]|nr:hypothetical protein [Candidatus Neomarinimicrobiota bacterium]